MRFFRRLATAVAIVGPLVLIAGAVLYAAGARVNTSRSVPVGLYRVIDAPPRKGAYILFCPPPRPIFEEARARGYIGAGPCPGGFGYVFKKILAAKDDILFIGSKGVTVNGMLLSCSAPREADNSGRPLPQLRVSLRKLAPSEILPMSDVSCTSFDGRYYGLIAVDQIRAVVTPVLTW